MTDLTLYVPHSLPALIAQVVGLLAALYAIYRVFDWTWNWFKRRSEQRDAKIINRRINQGWRDAAHRQERIAGYDWREAKAKETQNRDY